MKITVTHEYAGLLDYWGGNGRRFDNDAGCLFAGYGAGTTLRDCVDQWCDDFWMGGDCDSFPDDVSQDDIRTTILASLTRQGRDDYESGALAECAADYGAINGIHDQDHDFEDCGDSPVWVILVEITVCSECGVCDDYYVDDLCNVCTEKHYLGFFDDHNEFISSEG